MRFRLIEPGQPDVRAEVSGDTVVIGRDGGCDIVVPRPFVSKRHVQILRGLVIVDLDSSNSTFVGALKLHKKAPATLLTGRRFSLANKLEIELEEGALAASADGKELGVVRAELEAERARAEALRDELAGARAQAARHGSEGAGKLGELRAENEDLRRRLGSLKEEIEGREVDASESYQVRLAEERRLEAQGENERLAARVRELEGLLRAAAAGSSGESARLLQQKDEELARLRLALAEARPEARSPSEVFVALQEEIGSLRAKVAHYESDASRPGLPASELFFELSAENRALRQRLEELEASAPAARPRATARAAEPREPVEVAALRDELERLRRRLAAPALSARPVDPGASGGLAIVRLALEPELPAPRADLGAEEFLVLESLAFLRKLERVITRVAGELIHIYDPKTQMPNVAGNFRTLAGQVLDGGDEGPRRELGHYLKELERWLGAGLGAYRQAGVTLVLELKQSLSEEGLTAGRPIPAFKRLAAQYEAELWKRSCAALKEFSRETVEERVGILQRRLAAELLASMPGR